MLRKVGVLFLCITCLTSGMGLAWAAESGHEVQSAFKNVVTRSEIEQELLAAPKAIRRLALSSQKRLEDFISPILSDRKIYAAAKTSGFLNQKEAKAAIARSERLAVVRVYLQNQIDKKLSGLDTKKLEPLAHEQYLANKEDYSVPETISFAQIFFKVDPALEPEKVIEIRKRAESVLAKLKAGGNFGALAKQYSDEKETASNGGVRKGFFTVDKFLPQLRSAFLYLKPGQTSGLIKTSVGYHIVKLLAVHPAKAKPFEAVKASIIKQIKDKMQSDARARVLGRYGVGDQHVVISDDMYRSLKKEFLEN